MNISRKYCFFAVVTMLQSLSYAQNIFPKTGRIGIQNVQPRVDLDVNGITFSNAIILGDMPANQPGIFQLQAPFTREDTTIFLISNPERRLFQIGNDGVVRTREVFVNLKNDWPDYVFEKDYRLRPLSNLDAFIQEKGHLPGIPSAEEINQNGMNVGEMNRLLLEKIEELTLYLIEQEKRIHQLEEELRKKH
jgi:hypothetical protein